jgi:hypothetical protein
MGQIPISERRIEPSEVFDVESYGGQRTLAWPTSEMYYDILDEAEANGYGSPWFRLVSGYRSLAAQQRLYDAHPTKDSLSIARPGRSSHHTGHTMDLYVGHKPGYSATRRVAPNVNYQRSTPQYQWFASEIAPKYGLWELPSEPWHWECDRDCRANYLMTKYGVDSNLAYQIANSEVDVPDGDFLTFLDQQGHSYRLASDDETVSTKNKVGKVLIGVTVLGLVGLGAWYYLDSDMK